VLQIAIEYKLASVFELPLPPPVLLFLLNILLFNDEKAESGNGPRFRSSIDIAKYGTDNIHRVIRSKPYTCTTDHASNCFKNQVPIGATWEGLVSKLHSWLSSSGYESNNPGSNIRTILANSFPNVAGVQQKVLDTSFTVADHSYR